MIFSKVIPPFLFMVSENKITFSLVILLGLLLSLFEVLFASTIASLISINLSLFKEEIFYYLLGFLILRTITSIIYVKFSSIFSYNIYKKLIQNINKSIFLECNLEGYKNANLNGEYTNTVINTANTYLNFFVLPSFVFFCETIIFLSCLIILIILNYQFVIISFSFLLILFFTLFLFKNDKNKNLGFERLQVEKDIINFLRELFLIRINIQSFDQYNFFINKFDALSSRLSFIGSKQYSGTLQARSYSEFFLFIILFSSLYLTSDDLNSFISGLLTISVFILRIISSSNKIYTIIVSYSYQKSSINSLEKFFNQKIFLDNQETLKISEINNGNSLNIVSPSIIFDNIIVKATINSKIIDVNVQKGDRICILGHSGSGKTTILNYLSCLQLPNPGYLVIDNHQFAKPLDLLPSNFYYTSGQSLLFNSSLIKNITLKDYNSLIEYNKVTSILLSLGLYSFSSHENLDKIVNSELFFSLGEMQRVIIARAIFQEKDLILLDEPTSNLDHDSTILVSNALNSLKNSTIIITTHSIVLPKYFDSKIIEI